MADLSAEDRPVCARRIFGSRFPVRYHSSPDLQSLLPPISNEVIVLIKDTALASAIALVDIMRVSEMIVNRDGSLAAYVIAAGMYLVFTFFMTVILTRLEKRFSKFE